MNKVLQISGTMNLGGQETFIMNLYRSIDKSKIQFDFVVNGQKKGFYEEEIEKMGGKIFHVTPMSKNVFKHFLEVRSIIKNNNYVAVHRHSSSAVGFVDLLAAKFCNIKTTIFHSHTTNIDNKKLFHYLTRFLMKLLAKHRFACSEEAGKFMFGDSKFSVIPNGIDINKFSYSGVKRNKLRSELNIPDDSFVIGHVGRFTYAKNHPYIMKIFEKIYDDLGKNVYLLLVGDGVDKDKIINENVNKDFFKNVIILSNRNDVNDLLSCMDIFVFPSHYEGLPVSLVEAQAANLPIIISENISDYVIIDKKLVKKMKIDDNCICAWVDYIIDNKSSLRSREKANKKISDCVFNIDKVANMLLGVYLGYDK